MKVLITGGLGWLGNALTETVGKYHEVCGFDLETPDVARDQLDYSGEIRYGTITEFEEIQSAIKGKDAIIHAAVASTVTRGQYVDVTDTMPFDVNIRGTCNVLEAAQREGVTRIIQIAAAETHLEHPSGTLIDSNTPYFGQPNYYDLTKNLQEQICRWFSHHYGLNIVLLRLGDIVDVKTGRSKKGEDIWLESMRTESWIDRYDVGNACLNLLQYPHTGIEIFHLVGAPSAQSKFDIERTLQTLNLELTSNIDQRPASKRD